MWEHSRRHQQKTESFHCGSASYEALDGRQFPRTPMIPTLPLLFGTLLISLHHRSQARRVVIATFEVGLVAKVHTQGKASAAHHSIVSYVSEDSSMSELDSLLSM